MPLLLTLTYFKPFPVVFIVDYAQVGECLIGKCRTKQGSIQGGFITVQSLWDPKFLPQINRKLKILKVILNKPFPNAMPCTLCKCIITFFYSKYIPPSHDIQTCL